MIGIYGILKLAVVYDHDNTCVAYFESVGFGSEASHANDPFSIEMASSGNNKYTFLKRGSDPEEIMNLD